MKVLSLFDGMSCGRVALERIGVKVDKYYAAEIDKYARGVAQYNYPDTIQLGDVRNINGFMLEFIHGCNSIDLLIGGSPCQGFSFAGKQLNFDDPRSKLFFEYVRLLKELKPKYFLLENVRMKKESQDVISKFLGVEPIAINSNLLSAQNRHRLYWTNIPGVEQPEDKGLLLEDILEDGEAIKDKANALLASYSTNIKIPVIKTNNKSQCLDANYAKGADNHGQRTGCIQMGYADIKGHDMIRRVYSTKGKSPTLTAVCGGNQERKIAIDAKHWRKLTPIECERLQTLDDNYTGKGIINNKIVDISNAQRYKMIGNGWTVDVIVHIFKFFSKTACNVYKT